MNITANTSISGSTEVSQPDVRSSRRAQSGASSVEDRTRLSANQDQTQQLRAEVARQPEVRQDRVAAVRQSLTNGTGPSNDQIAGAILNEYSQS